MPTSRRRVVTHRKASPPTDHCSSTVAASRWSTAGKLAARLRLDRDEVADHRGERVGPAVGGDDAVLQPEPELAGQIDAGLDGEAVPGEYGGGVALDDVGFLVFLDAHAVAGAVDEAVAQPGALDDPTGG